MLAGAVAIRSGGRTMLLAASLVVKIPFCVLAAPPQPGCDPRAAVAGRATALVLRTRRPWNRARRGVRWWPPAAATVLVLLSRSRRPRSPSPQTAAGSERERRRPCAGSLLGIRGDRAGAWRCIGAAGSSSSRDPEENAVAGHASRGSSSIYPASGDLDLRQVKIGAVLDARLQGRPHPRRGRDPRGSTLPLSRSTRSSTRRGPRRRPPT